MKTFAVIIVNWNSWALLARCLQALAAQTYRDFSVTIIDNASREAMPDNLLADYPEARLVRNPRNLGFAAANNLAVREYTGDSEWLALLNPDAFPQPDWLAQLMRATGAHPDCAVFASRQLDATDPARLDGDGDIYHISGRAWRAGRARKAPRHSPAACPVFSPCAAAGLYRRSAYNEAGGFDEDFFCYFEDVDLGFRLQLLGHRCLLIPGAVVHHLGSATTGGQHGDFAVYHGHRNLVWTYFKNMPGILFWIFLPLHLAINLAALLRHGRRFGLVMRAKRDALIGLPAMLKKRRDIQRRRRVTLASLWRILDKRLLPKNNS